MIGQNNIFISINGFPVPFELIVSVWANLPVTALPKRQRQASVGAFKSGLPSKKYG